MDAEDRVEFIFPVNVSMCFMPAIIYIVGRLHSHMH